jgi:outer membrane usher protein
VSTSPARRKALTLAICAGLLAATGALPAWAATTGASSVDEALALPEADASPALADGESVYAEVWRGELNTGLVAHLQWRGGRLAILPTELAELGVAVPPGQATDAAGFVALDDIPGLSWRFDNAEQRLLLGVPTALRPRQALGYQHPEAVQATRGHGLLLNYDAYARSLDGDSSLAVATSLRWFGRAGTLQLDGVSRTGGGDSTGYERLDTRWTRSDPVRMLTWSAGDVTSGSLPWTRSVRLGGLQLRRNFAVRPDLITYPVPRFAGQATVPSTVELLVNNVQQFGAPVDDGPFVLDAFPRITGAGQATLVVRDALGRTTQTTLPLYVDAQRLAPGLSDFSVEIGSLRVGYGGGTGDYLDSVVASGSVRRGITSTLTLEGHGEAGPDLRLAGIGAVWSPGGRWGLLTGAVSQSEHAGTRGSQVALGYQWIGPRFGADFWMQRTGHDYADLGTMAAEQAGSRDGANEQQRASFWLPVARGNLSLTWLRLAREDEETEVLRTLSWTGSLTRNVTLSLNAFSSAQSGHGAGLSINVPLGGLDASLALDHADGRTQTVAALRHTPAYDGGWGWEVQAGDRRGGFAQASANLRARWGDTWFGVDHADGRTGAFAQAAGSLAWLGGHGFAGRRIPDAFAVVSTGLPDVPVLFQHRVYGRTDARGLLLVPELLGWQRNTLGIDPDALGADVRVPALEQTLVPADGVGLQASFPIARLHPALIVLLAPDGSPAPAGRQGRVRNTDATFLVGYDGQAYVEDARPGAELELAFPAGTCRYRVPGPAAAAGSMPTLGPLPCEMITP